MDAHHHHDRPRSLHGKWVLLGFLIVAAYFLWTEHKAHATGALPYLLLLACPLMHLFHHHGHGRRHNGEPEQSGGDAKAPFRTGDEP